MTLCQQLSVPLALSTLAACAVAPAAPAPAAPPPRPAGAEAQALIDLEHRWVASYVAADADFLEALYFPDTVFINSRGDLSTGRQEIDEVRTGAVRYRRFDTWDVVPRIHGDAAVVTARSRVEGVFTATQREFAVDLRVLDVFTRAGTGWKLVASQATRIAPVEPAAGAPAAPPAAPSGTIAP